MKRTFFLILWIIPVIAFSQNEVNPDGYKLLIILLALLVIPLIFSVFWRIFKKKGNQKVNQKFHWKKLKLFLDKDRKYRPGNLYLKIENVSSRDIDIEAPVLFFRKLWRMRKFKLKGINRQKIYPLYLEKGKTHELQIDLSIFYQHDKKLKRFYWAKIKLRDTKGKRYSSKYITLRKSLFS